MGATHSTTYTNNVLDGQFVGTIVALNAAGDRLVLTAPRLSPYDPDVTNNYNTQVVANTYGRNLGTVYIIDYNPNNKSWSTNSYISSKYLLGTKDQFLGNCAAINADGTVFAIGSTQGAGDAGFLNVYNYNTRIGLKSVNAFASNGFLTIAGGYGTTNVFAYSQDGGITWNNSNYDYACFNNGVTNNIDNTNNFELNHIIENPNQYTDLFGGGGRKPNNVFISPGGVDFNSNGTIMAIGAPNTTGKNNNLGVVYIYKTSTIYGSWALAQTIENPDAFSNNITTGDQLNLRILYERYWANTIMLERCGFGSSVSLNSDASVLAVASYRWNFYNGAVFIYLASNNSTQWTLVQTISNPYFKTFTIKSGNWYTQTASLFFFGTCIKLSNNGEKLIISAGSDRYSASISDGMILSEVYASGVYPGVVYIYNANSNRNKWFLQQKIPNPHNADCDWFGNSISLNANGTILAIGSLNYDNYGVYIKPEGNQSYYNGGNVIGRGKVYLYSLVNNTWTPVNATLPKSTNNRLDLFGASVSLNATGNILAVGVPGYNSNAGYVSIYKTTDEWNTVTKLSDISGTDISRNAVGNLFGASVLLDSSGDVLIVGAPGYTYNSATGAIYTFNTITTKPTLSVIINNQGTNFGLNISSNTPGTIIAVNASGYNNNIGRVYCYNYNNIINTMNTRQCNTIAVNPNIWVAGGGAVNTSVNPFFHSLDGMNWLYNPNNGSDMSYCNVIKWNGGKFVAGGLGTNPLAYSYDGITWLNSNNSNLLGIQQCMGLTWNGTYWIATVQTSQSGSLAHSSDGINWKLINTGLSLYFNSVTSRKVLSVTGGGAGGSTSQISLATLHKSLGYNQTWADVTSFRATGISYVNQTGRPIIVNVHFLVEAAGQNFTFFVDGLIVGSFNFSSGTGFSLDSTATFVIPPNLSYNSKGKFISWFELS